MEEVGDAEKYSFGIFYNNVHVYVERMPGNPRLITSMQVYDAINNKSATVDLIAPLFEESHEGKRSVCTRLVEMAGRTRQNTDYKLEKYGNGAITVSDRKASYCMSQLSSRSSGGETMMKDETITKTSLAFKATFDGPSGFAAIAAEEPAPSFSSSPYRLPLDGLLPSDKKREDNEEELEMETSIVFGSYDSHKKERPKVTITAGKSKNLPVGTKKKAYCGRKQS